jgi:hypothetical protein
MTDPIGKGDNPPSPERALDAALDAADPDRLLPGENPKSTSAEDASHWESVYAELVEFKYKMLAEANQGLEQMGKDARTEVAQTDTTVLEAELDRLRRRHDFWARRHKKLDGGGRPS